MRLLICAGGTGGGVYPALAVVEQLKVERLMVESSNVNLQPAIFDLEMLWIGGKGGMEAELVKRAGIRFETIPAAGVHGVGLRALPRNLWQLGRGILASRRILREFQPDVLFFTGGYVAVPMALAGRKIPSLLFVPDIEPGLALKTLARFADRIAVTDEESFKYFKSSPLTPFPFAKHPRGAPNGRGVRGEGSRGKRRIIPTGYPARADLGKWTRGEARRSLDLDAQAPLLLVAGGSKGARSINNAVLGVLPDLLERAQVIHISGELDWPIVEAKGKTLEPALAARYHAFPYLYEQMGAALAAADLAISRAGASTLGEYPLFGLPAVLVPYPYAWRYQKVNAEALVRHGAAVVIEDADLPNRLLATVDDLFGHPQKLAAMRQAMQHLSHPLAAAEIGRLLLALPGERRSERG